MENKLSNLARYGGSPVWEKPFSPWPYFDEEMVELAADVLRSGKVNYWTGPWGKQFEEDYATYLGMPCALSVANGTVALELILQAFGIGNGDEVVVPSRTFIATASAVVACGAKPVVADVDYATQNITAETIEAVVTNRTKAVIVVHLGGCPCQMDEIRELTTRKQIKLIEDCAQAHGAKYKGKPVGSLSDASAFSFCQDKILSTGGEGGLVALRDSHLYDRAWSYRDHGKNRETVFAPSSDTVFKWLHDDFGTNWRMTELQSALGCQLLKRLGHWVEIRRGNASFLHHHLAKIPGVISLEQSEDLYHSHYRYYAYLENSSLAPGWTRDDVVLALQAEGIPCGSGSCSEIYLEKAFSKYGFAPREHLPIAKLLGEISLMFLVHPTLTKAELEATVSAVQKVLHIAQSIPLSSTKAA